MTATAPGTVLHLAPHPDDECIGAPATLMALRDAGWHVVNLACSLGRDAHRARRLAEAEAACALAGFTLEVVPELPHGPDPLGDGDPRPAEAALSAAVSAAVSRHAPAIVVGPSPHDRHRGHEAVGRATLRACAAAGAPAPRLWLWGLWADLPFPTIAVAFGEARLAEVLGALGAHAGELGRNDYRRVVRGRAEMNASLAPERVFGFGSDGGREPYAEVLCEVVRAGDRWRLGLPHWLDASDPLVAPAADAIDIGPWLEAPSLTERFGPPGGVRSPEGSAPG